MVSVILSELGLHLRICKFGQFVLLARNMQPELHQFRGKFGAFHKFEQDQDTLNCNPKNIFLSV